MASHTLSDEEYGTLINQREEARTEAGKLRKELARVRAEDPANRIAPLNQLTRATFEIVRFAVANLNPENTRGWPTKALNSVADLMATLPDYQTDDGDFATELRSFARDCEDYALDRARKRQEKLDADAKAPKGDISVPAPTGNAP